MLRSKPASVLFTVAVALASAALPAHAAGSVEVSYVKPDQFSDAGRTPMAREATMKSLTAFLQTLGRKLPDGQTLRVQFTDINLAGELQPWRTDEVRVLRGRADWPRISLHYTLLASDKVIASGDADLSDMNYLASPPLDKPRLGDLPFEKRMLQKWFDTTVIAR
jgi:hypothetical protein